MTSLPVSDPTIASSHLRGSAVRVWCRGLASRSAELTGRGIWPPSTTGFASVNMQQNKTRGELPVSEIQTCPPQNHSPSPTIPNWVQVKSAQVRHRQCAKAFPQQLT